MCCKNIEERINEKKKKRMAILKHTFYILLFSVFNRVVLVARGVRRAFLCGIHRSAASLRSSSSWNTDGSKSRTNSLSLPVVTVSKVDVCVSDAECWELSVRKNK